MNKRISAIEIHSRERPLFYNVCSSPLPSARRATTSVALVFWIYGNATLIGDVYRRSLRSGNGS